MRLLRSLLNRRSGAIDGGGAVCDRGDYATALFCPFADQGCARVWVSQPVSPNGPVDSVEQRCVKSTRRRTSWAGETMRSLALAIIGVFACAAANAADPGPEARAIKSLLEFYTQGEKDWDNGGSLGSGDGAVAFIELGLA